MRISAPLLSVSALGAALFAAPSVLVAQEATGALEARVWVDRGGEEPVLRRGENVRIYYRTSDDAFAAIFRIDTDGRVSLLYPQHPGAVDVVRGGRDYRLLPPQGDAWRVEEDPGMGYLFIVASPEPLDFSLFPYDEHYGWDVGVVGAEVYTDPYVAIDDFVATIVPGWETVPYGLDFLTYSVGETYSYPRFLCYDCHTYQRFASWNPYDYNCVTYRVVIWDDPYFYPRYRYSGVNVVYAYPVRALPRYEVTRRVVGDAVAPIVRVRTPAARQAAYAAYKESPVAASPRTGSAVRRSAASPSLAAAPDARSSRASATPTRRSTVAPLASPQERPRSGVTQQVPDTTRSRPTLQRRPSARLPVRTPPATRATPPEATEPRGVSPAPTRTSPRAPISRTPPEPRTTEPAPSTSPSGTSRAPQAAPARPSGTREPQVTPARPSGATREPQVSPSRPSTARPSSVREPEAAPTQPRASVRSAPRPSAQQPSGNARSQPSARPTTPSAGSGNSRPAPSRPSASPAPSRPRENQPARSSAPPRSDEPRPTVRSRPAEPPDRN
jgi:hypothetical protein